MILPLDFVTRDKKSLYTATNASFLISVEENKV